MNKRKVYDLLERAGWTAAQAVLGIVTAESLGLPAVYVPIIAVALSVVKSFVAGKLGNKDTVSTLPKAEDPATY